CVSRVRFRREFYREAQWAIGLDLKCRTLEVQGNRHPRVGQSIASGSTSSFRSRVTGPAFGDGLGGAKCRPTPSPRAEVSARLSGSRSVRHTCERSLPTYPSWSAEHSIKLRAERPTPVLPATLLRSSPSTH